MSTHHQNHTATPVAVQELALPQHSVASLRSVPPLLLALVHVRDTSGRVHAYVFCAQCSCTSHV